MKNKVRSPASKQTIGIVNYHKPGFVYSGLLLLAGTKFSFLTSISQRPDLRDLHVRDFDVHKNKKSEQQSDALLLSPSHTP